MRPDECIDFSNGNFDSQEFGLDGDIYIAKIGDVTQKREYNQWDLISRKHFELLKARYLIQNDILMTLTGDPPDVGKVQLIYEPPRNKLSWNQRVALLRLKRQENISSSEYLFAALSSKYCREHAERWAKGIRQRNVGNPAILNMAIPILPRMQSHITNITRISFSLLKTSRTFYAQTQTILLSELVLADWQPKRRLTFVKSHCEVEKAERADAEYFQPKYEEIKEAIKRYPGRWARLGELCELVGHPSNPPYSDAESEDKTFVVQKHLGDFTLTDAYWSDADSKHTTKEFLKKNAQYLLQKKDLVLYTVGGAPHIGKANIIFDDRIPATIGSFVTLVRANENKINPFLLLVLFNSPIGYLLTNRFQRGMVQQYIYPKDLVQTVIPIVPEAIQVQIEQKVVDAFNLQEQSKQLLECAKRAVEIAIEQNEQTAIDWLEHETKGFHS